MRDILLKLFTAVSTAFFVMSCGPSSCVQAVSNNGNETEVIMKAVTDTLNRAQLDSVCVADGLNTDFGSWMATTFVDYESNMRVTKYVWINSISEDEEVTYIVVQKDTLFILTKRTINSEETDKEE